MSTRLGTTGRPARRESLYYRTIFVPLRPPSNPCEGWVKSLRPSVFGVRSLRLRPTSPDVGLRRYQRHYSFIRVSSYSDMKIVSGVRSLRLRPTSSDVGLRRHQRHYSFIRVSSCSSWRKFSSL